jgi:hypothetical protein
MPTAFFRTKLRHGVSREDYSKWVVEFVYPHVEHISSVLSHRIYQMKGSATGGGGETYDNIEVIKFTSKDDYDYDLQHNKSAAAIAEQMSNYVEVLDSAWGTSVPPGVSRNVAPKHPNVKEKTLKCRTGQHVYKVDFFPVPSTKPGHIVGAGQSGGLAFFEGGEVANLSMGFTVDFPDGANGTHALYTAFSFEDGSDFVILELGDTIASEDGKTSTFTSTSISFIRGGGRFSGIKGSGVMTGKRFAPLGQNVDTYLDYTLTYTLPSS